MVRLTMLGLCCMSLLIVAGCGASGTGSHIGIPSVPQSKSATLSDGLTATFSVNTSSIRSGDNVSYMMNLSNNTALPITFHPLTANNFFPQTGGVLTIINTAGQTLFPPVAAPPSSIQTLPAVTLQPGKSLSGTITPTNIFNTRGTYSASAVITVQDTSSSTGTSTAAVGPLVLTVF